MRADGWARGGRLAVVLALALAGCGRGRAHGGFQDAGDGSDRSVDGGRRAPAAEGAKLNDYITGFNTLIGTFGLEQQFAQYKGQQIAQKSVNDSVFVNIGWVDNALDSIDKARRDPGHAPELDAAGDRELQALAPLVAQLKGLSIYYTSRGQLADGFARGKREDPQVIARFQAAIAALPTLSDAIDAVQTRRDVAELAALKAQGDTVGYDHGLAMQKAKQLVALADSPQSLADPAKQAKGEQLIAQIQQALADETRAHARTANSIEHGARDSMYDGAGERLQGLIGAYRNLRQNPTPFGHQMLVSAYNDAVQEANYAP